LRAGTIVAHPVLVLGVGRLAQALGMRLEGLSLTVLVVIPALPSASSIPMLAERVDADAGRFARTVPFAAVA
jgi:malonate transporter